jgi:hypothetical protein
MRADPGTGHAISAATGRRATRARRRGHRRGARRRRPWWWMRAPSSARRGPRPPGRDARARAVPTGMPTATPTPTPTPTRCAHGRARAASSPTRRCTRRRQQEQAQACHAGPAAGEPVAAGNSVEPRRSQKLDSARRAFAPSLPRAGVEALVPLVTEFQVPPHDCCGFAGSAELLKAPGCCVHHRRTPSLLYPTSSIHSSASSLSRRVPCAPVPFASCWCLLCGCGDSQSSRASHPAPLRAFRCVLSQFSSRLARPHAAARCRCCCCCCCCCCRRRCCSVLTLQPPVTRMLPARCLARCRPCRSMAARPRGAFVWLDARQRRPLRLSHTAAPRAGQRRASSAACLPRATACHAIACDCSVRPLPAGPALAAGLLGCWAA